MRDEDFFRQQEIAATLADDDTSDRAAVARGATLLHRTWGSANETRTKLRYTWHEFFKRVDVLLTPVAATAAFSHDHNPIATNARSASVAGRCRTRCRRRCSERLGPPRARCCSLSASSARSGNPALDRYLAFASPTNPIVARS
jgi:hypothetical protein